ncbi:hypothetical protein SF123566_2195 [Shigella flexneri 1235-66]|nr:hypothetical protein SF123566_2195 [Shigella flexneri 1235-66]
MLSNIALSHYAEMIHKSVQKNKKAPTDSALWQADVES